MLVQRSEGNTECHSSGAIGPGLVFSFLFETSSLNNLKHIKQLNWLVGEPRGSAGLCLPSAGVTVLAMTHSFSYMTSGNWTQILCKANALVTGMSAQHTNVSLQGMLTVSTPITHAPESVYNSKQNGQRTLPTHWSVYSSRNKQAKTISI